MTQRAPSWILLPILYNSLTFVSKTKKTLSHKFLTPGRRTKYVSTNLRTLGNFAGTTQFLVFYGKFQLRVPNARWIFFLVFTNS